MNDNWTVEPDPDNAGPDDVIDCFIGEDMLDKLTGEDMFEELTGEDSVGGLVSNNFLSIGNVSQNISHGASNWQPDFYSFQQPQSLQYLPRDLDIAVIGPQPDQQILDAQSIASLVIPKTGQSYQIGVAEDMQSTMSECLPHSNPSSNLSSQNWIDMSKFYAASHTPPGTPSATRNRRNERFSQDSTLIYRSSVKKQNGYSEKFHPANAILRLEKVLRSCPEMPASSKQKFSILLRQFKLLVEEANLQPKIMNPESPSRQSEVGGQTSFTPRSIFSENHFLTPQSGNPSLETEDGADIPHTPLQAAHDAGEDASAKSKHEIGLVIMYWCTKKGCGYSSHLEVDWKRHEQNDTHWPQECFMCLKCPKTECDPDGNLTCSFCLSLFLNANDLQLHYLDCEFAKKDGKTFGRKDHFCKHLREKHFIQDTTHLVGIWRYSISSNWPRQCGYCGSNFQNWNQRTKHIADHYRKGASLKDWKLPFPRRDASNRTSDFHHRNDDSDDEDFKGKRRENSTSFKKPGNITRFPSTGQSFPQGLDDCPKYHSQSVQGSRNRQRRSITADSLSNYDKGTNLGDSDIIVECNLALDRYLNDNDDWFSGTCISDRETNEWSHSSQAPESFASSSSSMLVAKQPFTVDPHTQIRENGAFWVPSAEAEIFELNSRPVQPTSPHSGSHIFVKSQALQVLSSEELHLTLQLDPVQSKNSADEMSIRNSPGRREPLWAESEEKLSAEQLGNDKNKKKGRRHGALNFEMRNKVATIRKRGACCRCRLLKTPCSAGLPCLRCKNMQPSPWSGRLCVTEKLGDYVGLLFPDAITSHLADTNIDALMEENISRFIDNKIEINLTFGPKYPPISLMAHEFVPRKLCTMVPDHIYILNAQEFKNSTTSFQLPISLLQIDLKCFNEKYSNTVRIISQMARDAQETTEGDTSIVVWKVINAVTRFKMKSELPGQKDSFLHRATTLYTMNYIMSHIIFLTEDSAQIVVARLRSPALIFESKSLTSILINLQVKKQINVLLQKTTRLVLRQLEEELMNIHVRSDSSTWATSFCVILVLCTCIESVQIATDGFNVSKLCRKEPLQFSRQDYFFKLENIVFRHSVELFHTVYKTRNIRMGRGLNPIRDGLEVDQERGITQPMVDMVDEMKEIICSHENDIKNLVKDPSFDIESDLLTSHMNFRRGASGRLLSRFLWSFLTYS